MACRRRALAVLLVFCALAAVTPAQRLLRTALPEHYNLHLAPDFATDTFAGRVDIDVQIAQPTRTIVLNAAELEFHEASVTAGELRQTASVDFSANETAALTVPQAIPAGRARISIRYTGKLNDQASRVLLEPRKQSRVRRHADGADRRAPRLSVVRRAGDESNLCPVSYDRCSRHGHLERPRRLGHAGPRRRQTYAAVFDNGPYVDLSRRPYRGRLGMPAGIRGRHSSSSVRDSGTKERARFRARSRGVLAPLFQSLFLREISVRKTRHCRGPRLLRRRHGKHGSDRVSRAVPAGGARQQLDLPSSSKSRSTSHTRSLINGSAIW